MAGGGRPIAVEEQLAEAELRRPGQVLAVHLQPHVVALAIRTREQHLGRLDHLISPRPQRDTAVEVERHRVPRNVCRAGPRLLQSAEDAGRAAAQDDRSRAATEPLASSAVVATDPAGKAVPSEKGPRGRGRRPLSVAVAVAMTGAIFLGVLLTLANRHGTLIVESDDPNVEVAVKRNGEEVDIVNAESNWKIRLKSGQYELALADGPDKFEIDQDSVVVRRGDEVRVKVTLKRDAAGMRETHREGRGTPPPLAQASGRDDDLWQPGPAEDVLAGLVPRPARLPGIGRWQIVTR